MLFANIYIEIDPELAALLASLDGAPPAVSVKPAASVPTVQSAPQVYTTYVPPVYTTYSGLPPRIDDIPPLPHPKPPSGPLPPKPPVGPMLDELYRKQEVQGDIDSSQRKVQEIIEHDILICNTCVKWFDLPNI